MFKHDYQSEMSFLVIDFTFLERRDGKVVVKDLASVDSHINRVSTYVLKRSQSWEKVPWFNARMNQAIDHECNYNDGDIVHSGLETVQYREALSAVALFCLKPQNVQFIRCFMDLTFIVITRLEWPPLAEIGLPGISCTFACHNTSRHVCAFRTVYSLTERLNFYIFSIQYAMFSSPPAYY